MNDIMIICSVVFAILGTVTIFIRKGFKKLDNKKQVRIGTLLALIEYPAAICSLVFGLFS